MKKKFGKTLSWIMAVSMLAALAMGLLPTVFVQASAPVEVSPANMNGWAFGWDTADTAGTSGFEIGPGTAPLGTGSLRLTIADPTGKTRPLAAAYAPGGTKLADITRMDYSTYSKTGNGNVTAIVFQFDVDYDVTDANTNWCGRLVYEPYLTSGTVAPDTWHTWDTLAGKWNLTKNPSCTTPVTVCTMAAPCTVPEMLAMWPNIGILSGGGMYMRAGGGWTSFDGNVDALTIGISGVETTYDFEPLMKVYVDDSWAGTPAGTDPDGAGPAGLFGLGSFATIGEAITAVQPTGTVFVASGNYSEPGQIVINKAVSIIGADKATTIITPGADTGNNWSGDARGWFFVQPSGNLTLKNMTLDGAGKRVSIGILAKGMATIENNIIKNIREDVYYGRGVAFYEVNAVVQGNEFSNIGRIGVYAYGAGVTSGLIKDNVYTGKGDGAWLDYAIELEGGAKVNVQGNTITGCTGVAGDGSGSAAVLLTTWFAPGTSGTFTDNVITGNSTGIYAGYLEDDTSTIVAHHNILANNSEANVFTYSANADLTHNYWAGLPPQDLPAGVLWSPWYADEAMTILVYAGPDTIVVPAGTPAGEIQSVFANAIGGDTIILPAEAVNVAGGFTIVHDGTTVVTQQGTIINASSPCFTVAADDVTISGPGLCNPSAGNSGVEVNTAVARLIVDGLEFDGTNSAAGSGVLINAAVDGLKIINNNIHGFSAGVNYTAAGVVTGVHEIQGNLLAFNTAGVANATAALVNAEFNNWGSTTCPALTNVDSDPCTYAAVTMVGSGTAQPDKVLVGQQITYTVQLDAKNILGADFDVDLSALLPYASIVSVTNGTVFDASCGLTNTAGVISYCGISTTKAPVTGLVNVFTVVLQGVSATTPPGVAFTPDATDDVFTMLPGYGSSTTVLANSLTGATLQVLSANTITGRIDLQGRLNDSGTAISLLTGAAQGFGYSAITNNWGNYSMTNVVDDTYNLTVVMPRYLDLPATSVTLSAVKTFINSLILLAGDANDDNEIGLSDGSIVGAMYGKSGATLTDPRADIDNSGTVNLNDLTLVGGNFYKTSATAYATWVP